MIINYIDYVSKMNEKIDAIIMVNKDGIIEYSGMYNMSKNRFMDEGYIGQHILTVYPELDSETSSHIRVMKTSIPILNEKQILTDHKGRSHTLINSTFPILYNDDLIGTIEISCFDNDASLTNNMSQVTLDDIISNSKKIDELKDKAHMISMTDSSVLVYGETGTGKELLAHAIHNASKRKDQPFISVNCATIPSTMIESTFFGTTTGSFTDAKDSMGLFEQANNGTLFLDDINSLNISHQAKLLRAIESQRFRPIGAPEDIKVNIRVISSLSENPYSAIKNNTLRSDLFYRLAVVQLHIPPLRQRHEDIFVLCDHFIKLYNVKYDKSITKISVLLKKMLDNYSWPGNIRELKNLIDYGVSMCNTQELTVNDIPNNILYNYPPSSYCPEPMTNRYTGDLKTRVDNFEKDLIMQELLSSKNMATAAHNLGISRQLLRYKIDKYRIM